MLALVCMLFGMGGLYWTSYTWSRFYTLRCGVYSAIATAGASHVLFDDYRVALALTMVLTVFHIILLTGGDAESPAKKLARTITKLVAPSLVIALWAPWHWGRTSYLVVIAVGMAAILVAIAQHCDEHNGSAIAKVGKVAIARPDEFFVPSALLYIGSATVSLFIYELIIRLVAQSLPGWGDAADGIVAVLSVVGVTAVEAAIYFGRFARLAPSTN